MCVGPSNPCCQKTNFISFQNITISSQVLSFPKQNSKKKAKNTAQVDVEVQTDSKLGVAVEAADALASPGKFVAYLVAYPVAYLDVLIFILGF